MLVGLGGNNGTTLTGGVIANREGITWKTKDGVHSPNYFGSLTQASTCRVGAVNGEEVHAPFKSLLPMVDPNDIVFDGWDISGMSMADAMERAQVLDWDLQRQLAPHMRDWVPRPGIYDPSFIAANQEARADNVIRGSKQEQMDQIRADIKDFKASSGVDKVVVLWTANTERYSELVVGVNDTEENLRAAIRAGEAEVSPRRSWRWRASTRACLSSTVHRRTFRAGVIDAAVRLKSLIAATTSSLVSEDEVRAGGLLVGAGIKPTSIVSYNHLGNNDGMNLSAPSCFRSKEISKSNVVDDMVSSNSILYKPGEHPDHVVVIKYVPYVGDSKRAMDEYTSEIFMGGRNTIMMHNTCEDSLLAAPLILDLCLIAELSTRIEFKGPEEEAFHGFHPISVLLRAMLENIFRACVGLAPENNMLLEHK